jgi:hypothetical protein
LPTHTNTFRNKRNQRRQFKAPFWEIPSLGNPGGAEGVGVADSVELRSRNVDRIKALLGSKGISNEQLAERSSLRPTRIKGILAGRFIRITANELTLIAAVLSTPVYCLLIPTDPAIEVEALEVIEKGRSSHA